MRISVLAVIVLLLVAGAIALMEQAGRETALAAGGVVALLGVALLVVSRRQLGKAFAVTPQAKGLVTHGLYAKIPHPMYVFLDTALLGVITMMRNPWLLGVVGALATVQVWQAGRERRVLEHAFGDEYREYRARTWW